MIDGLFLLQTEDAYREARTKLKERYGNNSIICGTFLDKIHVWPKIPPNDPRALRVFSDFVNQVVVAKRKFTNLNILDFPTESAKIVTRLPPHISCRWKDTVILWKTKHNGSYPPFETLAKFITDHAERENIPELQGIYAQVKGRRQNDMTNPRGVNSFAAWSDSSSSVPKCFYCKKYHHLDECKDFMNITRTERMSFLRTNGLCYACGSSQRHSARACRQRAKCRVCKRFHLTPLHIFRTTESAQCNCTNMCENLVNGDDSSMILPVWIRPKSRPEKEVLCYCILDPQSNTSFISDQLLSKLGVSAVQTYISLSTMAGTNVTQALRPRDIIVGKENEPYAQRSLLGWGIVGSICDKHQSRRRDVVSHRCVGNTSGVRLVKFTVPRVSKEILDPIILRKWLEMDFNEYNMNDQPISREDRRFIDILQSSTFQRPDGHYEMPLPMKRDKVHLPNNRPLAEARLNQLKRRFYRKPKYKGDYITFMKNVIDKYAEKVPSNVLKDNDGQVNYIPHTGVYHPKKPNKIRVVFDCAVKYQGICINDILLQGPDMLNGSIGVLCRFRKDEVAITADIEGMFHQFYVAEAYRDFLRFLWWKNDDVEQEIVEYRM
ncbi:uncharacterized protein LOC113475227 isoform X2 [Ciona intestinalis]